MNYRDPKTLSEREWSEIASLQLVRDSWGLDDDADAGKLLASVAYGVKFDFSPQTMPNYRGDLFLLCGDSVGEPLVLTRDKQGTLVPA